MIQIIQAAAEPREAPWFLSLPIATAALTGAITATGWFVLKWLDVRAQARLKRADFRRNYIEKQIEGFYGPLYSLAWQIVTTNHLKHRMLQHTNLGQRERAAIEDYFATNYFLPIHCRVKSILETKLYLVDGTVVPDSFYDYLEASLQETVQRNLWSEKSVSTAFIRGQAYPDAFQRTIYETLQRLMKEYEVNVRELTGKEAAKPKRTDPDDPVEDEESSAPFRDDYVA